MILKNKELGKYLFDFMAIEFDGIFNMDISSISERDQSVLFHEYIHFWQNISTSNGLRDSHYSLSLLGSYFYKLKKENKKISEHISLDSIKNASICNEVLTNSRFLDSNSFLEYNNLIVEDYHEDEEFIEIIEDSDEYSDKEKEVFIKTLPYVIELKIDDAYTVSFKLSSLTIQESMAAIIEKEVFGDLFGGGRKILQYEIVKEFCEFVLQREIDNKFIAEICEVSLLYEDSVNMFVFILEKMSDEKFLPEQCGDVLNFIESKLKDKSKFINDFNKYFASLISSINYVLPEAEASTKLRKCIFDKALNRAHQIRIDDNLFITRILWKKKTDEQIEYIKRLQYDLIPLVIIDRNLDLYSSDEFSNNEIHPLCFYNCCTLLNLFKFNHRECTLIDVCKKHGNIKQERICKNSPWINAHNCFFKIWINVWGLKY